MNKKDFKNNSQLEIDNLIDENELKIKWLSLIAHDFKGMFYNINFLLKALEDKMISQEQFQSMLPELKQISEKNLKTLNSTFTWVNSQTDGFKLQLENVSLYELFLEIKEDLRSHISSKSISFHYLGDENLVIQNDKLLLTFVLKQIVENAIKYSNKDDEVVFITRLEHNAVCINIKDHGVGMSDNVLNNIFTLNCSPYKGTIDEVGAGLSMVIVKDFVEKLGGSIDVSTKLNEGTIVKLMFGNKL